MARPDRADQAERSVSRASGSAFVARGTARVRLVALTLRGAAPRLEEMPSSPPAACRRRLLRALHGALLPALLLALALGGCKQDDRLAWVDRLLVSDVDLGSHPRLDLEADDLVKSARKALQDHGRIGLVNPGDKGRGGIEPWQGRVELVYLRTLPPVMAPAGDDASQPLRAEVGVELSLTRGAGTRMVGEGRAQQQFLAGGPEAREKAFRLAIDGALADAAEQLALHLETAARSDEELAAELGHADGQRREFALRVLADRKSPVAVPHLLRRLGEADRTVQLRAVGGLVAVGDERAVPPLIDATLGRDPSFVIQLVYAIGEIGGEDAEAYLFTASTGHPEEMVRRAAEESLQTLRREVQVTASTARPGPRK